MMKAFAKSLSMVHSASHSSMALALAQESLEKVRYEKDRRIRLNAVDGWNEFYTNVAYIEQTDESAVTTNEDGTFEDIDPCADGKRLRFINRKGEDEDALTYQPLSTSDNQGRIVVFSEESDREKITFYSGTGEDRNPINFYRQMVCKKTGDMYGRDEGEVLEFVSQVDWEYQGVPFALVLKMELANLEK